MGSRGFANHAVMGATLLGGLWFAIYLPGFIPVLRQGGWQAGMGTVAFLAGLLGGPLLLVAVEGDEFFGALGVGAALAGGWLGVRTAASLGGAPAAQAVAHLCGAALGPAILFGLFQLLASWIRQRNS